MVNTCGRRVANSRPRARAIATRHPLRHLKNGRQQPGGKTMPRSYSQCPWPSSGSVHIQPSWNPAFSILIEVRVISAETIADLEQLLKVLLAEAISDAAAGSDGMQGTDDDQDHG
jgi:hypothetical protein